MSSPEDMSEEETVSYSEKIVYFVKEHFVLKFHFHYLHVKEKISAFQASMKLQNKQEIALFKGEGESDKTELDSSFILSQSGPVSNFFF